MINEGIKTSLRLAVKSAKYLSGKDYVQLMKRYEETISSFRHNMSASQADFIQTLRNDYAALHQEIAQTQVDGKHENRQLESGMQLDLNLEEKRRSESKGEIDQKAAGIEGYAEERITEIQEDLSTVSKQARSAIFAFGSVALASLVMYHVSSSGPH